MSATDGASRMSSVLGLNARPQTAMRLPDSEPKCCFIFARSRTFWRLLTLSTAFRIWKS